MGIFDTFHTVIKKVAETVLDFSPNILKKPIEPEPSVNGPNQSPTEPVTNRGTVSTDEQGSVVE